MLAVTGQQQNVCARIWKCVRGVSKLNICVCLMLIYSVSDKHKRVMVEKNHDSYILLITWGCDILTAGI